MKYTAMAFALFFFFIYTRASPAVQVISYPSTTGCTGTPSVIEYGICGVCHYFESDGEYEVQQCTETESTIYYCGSDSTCNNCTAAPPSIAEYGCNNTDETTYTQSSYLPNGIPSIDHSKLVLSFYDSTCDSAWLVSEFDGLDCIPFPEEGVDASIKGACHVDIPFVELCKGQNCTGGGIPFPLPPVCVKGYRISCGYAGN
eukprot:Phypoly_transcript_17285.p1 GENE.Phypoly_transcript_17285~~Phypoly_transcript_17285.p1  ORF type:complete len:201 (+),score=24.04 Phypoly_transcript_17285:174-776(+)